MKGLTEVMPDSAALNVVIARRGSLPTCKADTPAPSACPLPRAAWPLQTSPIVANDPISLTRPLELDPLLVRHAQILPQSELSDNLVARI